MLWLLALPLLHQQISRVVLEPRLAWKRSLLENAYETILPDFHFNCSQMVIQSHRINQIENFITLELFVNFKIRFICRFSRIFRWEIWKRSFCFISGKVMFFGEVFVVNSFKPNFGAPIMIVLYTDQSFHDPTWEKAHKVDSGGTRDVTRKIQPFLRVCPGIYFRSLRIQYQLNRKTVNDVKLSKIKVSKKGVKINTRMRTYYCCKY